MENTTNHVFEVTDLKFSWTDYSLFALTLLSSAAIGVYFGFVSRKQNTAKDYLLGGKQMHPIPIALSLISCNVSGITIMAVPSDVFRFGFQYWLSGLAMQLCILIAYYITLPVFFHLEISSTYEYLNMRFGNRMRNLASSLFALNMILYLPIVIYAPALALSQVTGFHIHIITLLVCGVCIFYTTIGGLKAVVWTDALQGLLMMISIVAVAIVGTVSVGGFKKVFDVTSKATLLDMNYDVDPTVRDTVWTILIGSIFVWANIISVGQSSVQKCLALPTFKEVKSAFIIFTIGIGIIVYGSVYIGLLIYTQYHDCDPLKTKTIRVPDQLLPYYVLDVVAKVPGLPGLFIAGVFSGGLSTLSAAMNALSCTVYKDFIAPHMSKDYPQEKVGVILKWLVVVIGIICTAMVFVVEQLGSILPLVFGITSITAGPLLGVFFLGMLVPKANSKGALSGCLSALAVSSVTIIGSYYYKMKYRMILDIKPTTMDECPISNNSTLLNPLSQESDWEPFYLFRISFYYYTLLGLLVVFLVAIPVSKLTEDSEPKVSKKLISPIIHFLMDEEDENENPPNYTAVKDDVELEESKELDPFIK
ncbi:PREDICTED: sodium-coupled monocarboxylate transporter 2-like [Nicrophorus vespilloides]|uniref:Sodium-coupled monocarboxylate transporter 2-like n=1 Tax=Nicrophorus vespilloides TaxID=110193 RepID=A0ABM1ME37_NICVS|nr:PREDICTED: sodium-coupled monocarboxylate transporter 2-like [Nicrophorus vespilloides]